MASDFSCSTTANRFLNACLSVLYIFRIKSAQKLRERTLSDYKNVGTVGVTKPILTIRQS